MSIWENQSKEFRVSITDSIRRWAKKDRSTQRKEKGYMIKGSNVLKSFIEKVKKEYLKEVEVSERRKEKIKRLYDKGCR